MDIAASSRSHKPWEKWDNSKRVDIFEPKIHRFTDQWHAVVPATELSGQISSPWWPETGSSSHKTISHIHHGEPSARPDNKNKSHMEEKKKIKIKSDFPVLKYYYD